MLKISEVFLKQYVGVMTRKAPLRSKHSNEGLSNQFLAVKSQKIGFHQSQIQEYPAAKQLPLPTNIEDIASTEKLIFSPQRSRDISGSFISFSSSPSAKDDDRIECYDCTGTVSLSSAMQTNVPFPFTSKGKPTHLNMPGGQWGQNQKYMSDDLNKLHHINVRKINSWNRGIFDLGLINRNKYLNTGFLTKDVYINVRYSYCTTEARNMSSEKETRKPASTNLNKDDVEAPLLSKKQKFKNAVKDYGVFVLVFHIGISLISYGCCYLLVVSGIDMTKIIQKWGIEEGAATAGMTSQIVVAYAIHKAMAPGRLAISFTVAPLIVKRLRKIGYLKPPKTN